MTTKTAERPSAKLSQATLLDMYWMMLLARKTDERAWVLHRQGKIAFHASGIGHEGAQVGAAFALNRGVDFVYPYYRDLALSMSLGVTPFDFLMSTMGKQGEYSSGGRQMPCHYSLKDANVVSGSSVVTTQVPQAAGTAFAIRYRQLNGLVDPNDETQPRLAFVCLGEGSTSQGEWHEGMNWAGVHTLPFICFVQNNLYAISVPMDQQMAVPNVADRAAAYGVKGVVVDGNNILDVYDVVRDAVERAYNGDGATLIEAKTYRTVPHSSDDDDRSYRSREEVEEWKEKDPILQYRQYLMDENILTSEAEDDYQTRAKDEVDRATQDAEAAPYPDIETLYTGVYAPVEEA